MEGDPESGAGEEGRSPGPGGRRGAATALSEDNGEEKGGAGPGPRKRRGLAPTDPPRVGVGLGSGASPSPLPPCRV